MPTETLPPPVPTGMTTAAPPVAASPDLRARLAQRLGPKSGITATPAPEPAKPPEPPASDAKTTDPAPNPATPAEPKKTARELDEPESEISTDTDETEPAEKETPKTEPGTKPEVFPDRRKADNKLTWKNLRTLQSENSTLCQQLEEFKNKVPDPTDHPKYKEALTKLETEQKRAEAAEKNLESTQYERSEGFKRDHVQPFLDANQAARRAMLSLDVVAPDGTMRAGAPEDWDRIMAITDPRLRMAETKRTFNEDSASLIVFARHETEIEQLTARAARDVAEHQAKGSERDKQEAETRQKQATEIKDRTNTIWKKSLDALMEKEGKWLKPIEGNDEYNEMLAAGYEKMKAAFSKLNLHDPAMPDEERATRIAGQQEIMIKGVAYDPLRLLFRKRGVLMREQSKQLAQYKGSEPKDGDGRGVKQTTPPSLAQRVSDRLAKLRQ